MGEFKMLVGLQLQEKNYVEEPSSENFTIQNNSKTSRLNYRPIENWAAYEFPESQQK